MRRIGDIVHSAGSTQTTKYEMQFSRLHYLGLFWKTRSNICIGQWSPANWTMEPCKYHLGTLCQQNCESFLWTSLTTSSSSSSSLYVITITILSSQYYHHYYHHHHRNRHFYHNHHRLKIRRKQQNNEKETNSGGKSWMVNGSSMALLQRSCKLWPGKCSRWRLPDSRPPCCCWWCFDSRQIRVSCACDGWLRIGLSFHSELP